MLDINNLHASVEGNEILRGVCSASAPARCTPSGTQRSARARWRRCSPAADAYDITDGSVLYQARTCGEVSRGPRPRKASSSVPYPVDPRRLQPTSSRRRSRRAPHRGRASSTRRFPALVRERMKLVKMDESCCSGGQRGFSAREKKRNEISHGGARAQLATSTDRSPRHRRLPSRRRRQLAALCRARLLVITPTRCSSTSSPTSCTCGRRRMCAAAARTRHELEEKGYGWWSRRRGPAPAAPVGAGA